MQALQMSRAISRYSFLAILGASMAAGAIVALPAERNATHCELRTVTQSGDLYILGSGDTCQDAFTNHAPIPSDYVKVWYERVTRQ